MALVGRDVDVAWPDGRMREQLLTHRHVRMDAQPKRLLSADIGKLQSLQLVVKIRHQVKQVPTAQPYCKDSHIHRTDKHQPRRRYCS